MAGGGYFLYSEHRETTRTEPVDAEVLSTDWYSDSAAGEQSETHSVTIEYGTLGFGAFLVFAGLLNLFKQIRGTVPNVG